MKTQFLTTALLLPLLAVAQPKAKKTATPAIDPDKQAVIADLDKRFPEYANISKQIWTFAELGYQEEKSSALLEEQLKK
jgi:aminobenzoyl-glutamate utilization protein B